MPGSFASEDLESRSLGCLDLSPRFEMPCALCLDLSPQAYVLHVSGSQHNTPTPRQNECAMMFMQSVHLGSFSLRMQHPISVPGLYAQHSIT